MKDKIGFLSVDSIEANQIIMDCENNDWRIFRMPAYISSKDEFFEAVRSTLPLAPVLHSNKSWDALADSLWGGLDNLDDNKILIVWPDTETMKDKYPDDYSIAENILTDLPVSLADAKLTVNKTKKLLVVAVN